MEKNNKLTNLHSIFCYSESLKNIEELTIFPIPNPQFQSLIYYKMKKLKKKIIINIYLMYKINYNKNK